MADPIENRMQRIEKLHPLGSEYEFELDMQWLIAQVRALRRRVGELEACQVIRALPPRGEASDE